MYQNLIGTAFTNGYAGIVRTSARVDEGVYRALAKSPPPGLEVSYFDYSQEDGALWIALGGEHAEPLMAWLQRAQERFECTSTLAVILDNGSSIPSEDAYAFTIRSSELDLERVRRLASKNHLTIYLPVSDEFLVLVTDILHWRIVNKELDDLPGRCIELTKREDVPSVTLEAGQRSGGVYDPIAAQVHEVLGPIEQLTLKAVSDLVREWERVIPPVPSEIRELGVDIADERKRLLDRVKAMPGQSGARDAVLADVDRFAKILRTIRRVACNVESKLLDYEAPVGARATYERMATPVMLRALDRYTADVARRFEASTYVFLPVIGEKFAMMPVIGGGLALTRPLLPVIRESKEPSGDANAIIIEIPAEVRLRLGAIPMIAREIAWLKEDDINRIANTIEDLQKKGDRWASSFLPPFPDKPSNDESERHAILVHRLGREMAADLLASAAVGPQFVFAMARFAVGTLSQSALGPMRHGRGLPFRTRLSACLSLLRHIGTPAEFTSLFLPETAVTLPTAVVEMALRAISRDSRSPDSGLERITEDLQAGRVVRADPIAILSALWKAVVARGRYANEIAALISIAAAD